jgi:hypothetical protein
MLKHILLASLVCLCVSTAKADSPPTKDCVKVWWKSQSKEEITIEGDLIEIRLRSKEIAYLVPVGFYQRGRNEIWHTVLVRPIFKEVREVKDPVRSDIDVLDLNNDGVSEIVVVALGSGGGSTIGARSIVQFQGWTPIVLHQVKFEDNEGTWGVRDNRYFSRSVSWEFSDLDNDGNTDLIEEITTKKGRNNKDPITTKVRRKFLFKNNLFVRYVD